MANADDTILTSERWRQIPGYAGSYEVSNYGRVRSVDRIIIGSDGISQKRKGKLMKTRPHSSSTRSSSGHLTVGLRDANHKHRVHFVHKLVLWAFVGPRPDGMVACHNDGDATNNHVENLRWDTQQSNIADQRDHGVNPWLNRTECPRGHDLELPNLVASAWLKGHRTCLACARTAAKVHRTPAEKPRFKEISDHYYEQIMK